MKKTGTHRERLQGQKQGDLSFQSDIFRANFKQKEVRIQKDGAIFSFKNNKKTFLHMYIATYKYEANYNNMTDCAPHVSPK